MSNCKITVFTPVYNRATLMGNVYNSLLKQNVQRDAFEWLIVDDGSTDNIKAVVDGFISENLINIRYYYKNNGGVHTAWNYGVKNAEGEFFFRCDSDDELYDDTLKKLFDYTEVYSDKFNGECIGITGLCKDIKRNTIIGSKFPDDVFISTGLDMSYKYKLTGERAGCMKTDILREYSLPEPADVNFVFESTMWFRIDRKYKTICVNDIFKCYNVNGDDSITINIQKTLNKKYCSSQFYIYSFYINEVFDYMLLNKKQLFKVLADVSRRGLESGRSVKDILRSIDAFYKKIFVLCSLPLGIMFIIKDKIRYTK